MRTRYVDLIVRVSAPKYVNQAPCIIGELPLLGNWKDHSHKMTLGEDGRFETKLRVQANTHVEFKFTLGSWESVEKGKRFNEIPNRKIIANRSHTSEFEIANFAGFEDESPNHTRKGKFEYIRNFASKHLENNRNILIYLPPSYKSNSSRKYPVLYMHDGNNLFDANTAFMGVEWEVDEAAERLIEMGLIHEIIIVGVFNTAARLDEYTPTSSSKMGGGRGPKYLKFLIDELMPVINQKFNTLTGPANTGIMGSSLGGLISLWAGFEHPDVFGRIGSISPSLWWDSNMMENEYLPNKNRIDHKIWLDMGTQEGVNRQGKSLALQDTRQVSDLLKSKGYKQGEDLYYFEHVGAYHDEASWASRIHMPLVFLFGKEGINVSLETGNSEAPHRAA
ncbi:MAG: alpha/beta hydrolase-fold protein [bacterium]|nr:alpha/beta hydrolase-fold protein [bacterium]